MAGKRQYTLMLYLSESMGNVRVEDPSLINPLIVKRAGAILSDFVEDIMEELGIEITDERYREVVIELLFKLTYHEMSTLHSLEGWEENFRKRVGTKKQGPSRRDAYKQWLYGEEDTTEY
jgi:uncharacterized protein YciU (UPF0263 family)